MVDSGLFNAESYKIILKKVMNSCHLRPITPYAPALYHHIANSLSGDSDDDEVSDSGEGPDNISDSGEVRSVEVSEGSISGEAEVEVSNDDSVSIANSVEFLFSVPPPIHDNTATSDYDLIGVGDEVVYYLDGTFDILSSDV